MPSLPLIAAEATRDGSLTIDARGVNMIAEKDANGMVWSYKRPAMVKQTAPYSGATSGIGLFSTPYGLMYVYTTTGALNFYCNGQTLTVTGGTFTGFGGYSQASSTASAKVSVAGYTGSSAWIYSFDGTTFTLLTSTTYPYNITSPASGMVQLDGTFYVMDTYGGIWGSGINDPSTWDPNNLVYANSVPGTAVALTRQLGYILAMKDTTVEVFYDAANATGSPLSAVPANRIQFGILPGTQPFVWDEYVFWIAQDNSGSSFVVACQNLAAKKISTAAIERVLNKAAWKSATVTMACGKTQGHTLLMVTNETTFESVVYDIDMDAWYVWDVPAVPVGTALGTVMARDGQIYIFDPTSAIEGTNQPVSWELVTPPFDGGDRKNKYLAWMDVLTDNTPAVGLQVRWSDDDQRTWTNWKSIDLASKAPRLRDMGSFTRRVFHFRHNGPQPLRLQSVNLNVQPGTL